ncbi:MAG: hypothetical protein M3R24_39725 [Chloroflexota bacterium]|nr:hypothetical protein [Chloroflexota bacterium]
MLRSARFYARFPGTFMVSVFGVVGLLLITGCGSDPDSARRPGPLESDEPPQPVDPGRLAGTWQRVTNTSCAAPYPTTLEFQANGIYHGSIADGSFSLWDVGVYRLEHGDRITITLANDAEAGYGLRMSDQTLTFTDNNGCTFTYRRAA